MGYQRDFLARGQIRYTWAMGILDNLEASLDWDESDIELSNQNPHKPE
jgi:hypothetical protein